jgi:hypothetical protein
MTLKLEMEIRFRFGFSDFYIEKPIVNYGLFNMLKSYEGTSTVNKTVPYKKRPLSIYALHMSYQINVKQF